MSKIDILSPNDSVSPIEVGDGYKDYLLSDVMASRNIAMMHGKIEADGRLRFFVFRSIAFINSIRINPIGGFKLTRGTFTGINDARIRLFDDGDPIWVSVFFEGKELHPKDL